MSNDHHNGKGHLGYDGTSSGPTSLPLRRLLHQKIILPGADDDDDDVEVGADDPLFAELHAKAEFQAAGAKLVRRDGHAHQWLESPLKIAFSQNLTFP